MGSSETRSLFEAFDNEKELLYKTPMQRVSFGMHWKQDFAAAAAPSFPRLNTHNTNVERRAQSVTGKNRLGTFNFHQLWNVDSCLRFWWSMKTVLTDMSLKSLELNFTFLEYSKKTHFWHVLLLANVLVSSHDGSNVLKT